jgi:nicotinamide-nucleotide amidase
MPASTQVQAQVPEGARVLHNSHGTAPGLIIELDANPFREGKLPAWIIMLPGPFRELRPMFLDQVLPYLKQHLKLGEELVCRILKCFGLGESHVQDQIAAPLKPYTDNGLELGYCARAGEVEVRLVAPKQQADNLLPEAEALVRTQLGATIFGMDDDTLESVVVRRLSDRREMLVIAESCTGGAVANRLTHVPGASEVLWGGLVTYHNHAKHQLLGVKEETLAAHGAVSEPVARQMAEGARHRYHTAFGLAITGIAGPGGGTPEKPVGTVYMAVATPDETIVHHFVNRYDRLTFKQITTNQALDLLRRQL